MWPPGAARILGIGCMRLSTEHDRDDDRSVAVLHAAFDAGVTLLDTADAYCLDDTEIGHNERLIARALDTWNGDRSRILVATKGGLTRPHGLWIADGRARHLRAACEASRRALGADRISLYQLHAPDPRTPLSTTVRALASLKTDGLIEAIGLCNVNVGQNRGGQTHYGHRCGPGRTERLAGREPAEWGREVLRIQQPPLDRTPAAGRPTSSAANGA
jgi:aryl-alcohol dehydrogenase-like predicted oxidoreductase